MDTVPAPEPWAEIAAELHRIADDAEKLIGQPALALFQISIQPKPWNDVAAIVAVDTIALALLGKPGKTVRMSDGVYHRNADAQRGPISLSVYRQVPEPPTAEIERLRARLAELEAQHDPTGLSYTRADDDAEDPTPPGPREPLHTGAMTERGLVDETPAEPHPTWPTEAELKPWETLAPPAGRLAESMEPIDPDSSMEAHYDAETEAMTGLGITDACVITGWAGLCTTHKARHIASGEAKCGCPVYPYAGRGDAADTIVDHRQNCKATS